MFKSRCKEIRDEVRLSSTVSPFDNIGLSSAIDRTVFNYDDAKNKVKEIRELISIGNYYADIARYISGTLDMLFQGILEDIATKEKVAHSSHKDMKQLDFQIMLTSNYYVNPNSIHLCSPMKIKKSSNEAQDIDSDIITVHNFFGHLVKEISVTKYESDKRTNCYIFSL